MKKITGLLIGVLIAVMVISCKAAEVPVLTLTGAAEVSFTQSELESMEMVESEYTNKDDEVTTYEGILIKGILENGGADDFNSLKIIASDGYSAEATAEELDDCSRCILAFDEENGWRTVMPGFSSKLQVRDVVELSVK